MFFKSKPIGVNAFFCNTHGSLNPLSLGPVLTDVPPVEGSHVGPGQSLGHQVLQVSLVVSSHFDIQTTYSNLIQNWSKRIFVWMGVLKWMGVLNTYSHVCPAHWPWCWYPNHFFAVNEPFCLFHGGDVTCFDVMKLLAEWDEVINSTRTKLLHLPQKVTRNSSLFFSFDF